MRNEIMELELVGIMILALLVFYMIILIPFILMDYYGSCQEAKVFNEINQTEYTCSDFYWAGDQINSNTQTIKLQ